MEFTKTERKILGVLSDGRRHQKNELKDVLPDQAADGLSKYKTVIVHVCHLRKKLQPIGQDIICEVYKRSSYYRHVRLLGTE